MTVLLGGAPGDSGVPGVLARRLSEGFWMAPTSMLSSEMLGERWTIAGARRDGGTSAVMRSDNFAMFSAHRAISTLRTTRAQRRHPRVQMLQRTRQLRIGLRLLGRHRDRERPAEALL